MNRVFIRPRTVHGSTRRRVAGHTMEGEGDRLRQREQLELRVGVVFVDPGLALGRGKQAAGRGPCWSTRTRRPCVAPAGVHGSAT